MGKNMKVKINRKVWGETVMAGPSMKSYLGGLAGQVAAKTGGTVEINTSGVVGGGARVRAWIRTSIPLSQEADTGEALAALRSVVPTAHASKYKSAAVRKARAVKKVRARAGRKIVATRRKAKRAA